MKIKNNSRKNLALPLVVLVILAALAGGVYYYYHTKRQTTDAGPTTQQKQEQKQTQAEQKQDFVENKSGVTSASPAPTPTDSDQISFTTTQQSDSIIVTTQLTGFASGTCRLIVTNGSKSITQDATILYQPEFSSCTGFSVPISSLGAGQWSLTLQATPTGGSTLEKTMTSTVK